jgi:integrase
VTPERDQPKKRRRGHHEGTGYQRGDGRWEWKITLPNGRRKSFYGLTQREAREKANQALKDLESGLDLRASTVTVGAFLDAWLESTARERVRPSTYVSYQGHVRHHLKPALGTTKLRQLTPQQVNAMLSERVANGMSPTTANLIRATLRTALSSAVKWGMVSQNVAALSDPRPVRRQRVEPLSVEQIQILLIHATNDRIGPLLVVAVHTGLRQGELLGLRWQDVDIKGRSIQVRHTLTRPDGAPALTDPKTEQSRRSIRLSDHALAALEVQADRVAESRMAAASRWQENDLVFPTTIGTFQHSSNVTHRFQKMLADAGLPRRTFHGLRHSTASILLREGVDLFTVKEVLGHSQIALTADTYGHLTQKLSDEAARRMGQAFMVDDE